MTTRGRRSRQSQEEAAEEENAQSSIQCDSQQTTDINDGSSDDKEDSDPAEDYGNLHKLILQGMMAAGYLDGKGVKNLVLESYKQLSCKPPTDENVFPIVRKVVKAINDRVKEYGMHIKSVTCEISGDKFYMFLVTIERQIMKFQTYFSKPELQLFQKIVDTILTKGRTYTISLVDCINIGANMNVKGFSTIEAEEFTTRMVASQYFTKVPLSEVDDTDGPNSENDEDEFDITLGFRTIKEFESIFRERYQDRFKNCRLCKGILLNGFQCRKCTTFTHRACFKFYNKKVKSCPNCKTPWISEKSLVVRRGEDFVEPSSPKNTSQTTSESHQESSQSQVSSP